MNDFTKGELKMLWRYVDDDINDVSLGVFLTDCHEKLRMKLQSMIDNYFEPEEQGIYDDDINLG